jgi:hypothetical protein
MCRFISLVLCRCDSETPFRFYLGGGVSTYIRQMLPSAIPTFSAWREITLRQCCGFRMFILDPGS